MIDFSGKPVSFVGFTNAQRLVGNVCCSMYPSSVRYQGEGITILYDFSSVADPGSGAFFTPGSGMGKKSGSGPSMDNPNHISESIETIFWVKTLKFFDAYPDPGSGIF
jgi:hypothetical protein